MWILVLTKQKKHLILDAKSLTIRKIVELAKIERLEIIQFFHLM